MTRQHITGIEHMCRPSKCWAVAQAMPLHGVLAADALTAAEGLQRAPEDVGFLGGQVKFGEGPGFLSAPACCLACCCALQAPLAAQHFSNALPASSDALAAL